MKNCKKVDSFEEQDPIFNAAIVAAAVPACSFWDRPPVILVDQQDDRSSVRGRRLSQSVWTT